MPNITCNVKHIHLILALSICLCNYASALIAAPIINIKDGERYVTIIDPAKFQTSFHSDPVDGAFKALGVE